MKFVKIFLIVSAISLLVLLLVAVAFVNSSGMQTALVRSIASSQVDGFSLEHIKLGTKKATLRKLSAEPEPGLIVSVESVALDYALMSWLTQQEVRVDRLEVTGILVDARNYVPTEKEDEDEGLGELEAIEVPVPVFAKNVSLNGKALLPDGGTASFTASLDNFAPGTETTIPVTLTYEAEAHNVATEQLVLKLKQDDQRVLHNLSLTGKVNAKTASVPVPVNIDLALMATMTPENGTQAEFSLIDQADAANAVKANMTLSADSTLLSAKATVAANRRLLVPFVPSVPLPEFDLRADADLSMNPQDSSGTVLLKADSRITGLQNVDARLSGIEALLAKADIDMAFTEATLTTNTIALSLSDATRSETAIDLQSRQQFTIDLTKQQLPSLRGPLATITLSNVPLVWAEPFTGGLTFGEARLNYRGELAVSDNQQASLTSEAPVRLGPLVLARDDQALTLPLNFEFTPTLEQKGDVMHVRMSDFSVTSQQRPLASGQIEAAHNLVNQHTNAQLDLQAQLPECYRQPVLPENALLDGSAAVSATLDHQSSGDLKSQATIVLANLLPADERLPIQRMDTTLNASYGRAGDLRLKGPVELVGSLGTSRVDANIQATIGNATRFEAIVAGPSLFTDDFLALAAYFNPPTEQPAANPQSEEPNYERDPEPLWLGINGKARLNIGKLVAAGNELTQAEAVLTITDDAIVMEPVKAQLYGANVQIDGKLTHDGKAAEPYALTGNVLMQGFNLQKYFAAKGDASPVLTGVFQAKGNLATVAPNLTRMTDKLTGSLQIQASNGRAQLPIPQDGIAGLSTGALADVGAIFGARSSNNLVSSISEIVQVLRDFQYDKLSIDLTRKDNLDISLNQFLLQGPEIRITGSGLVAHRDGLAIPNQPLQFQTKLFGKGRVARLLDNVGLVSGKPTVDGYFPSVDFPLTGTIANINTAALNSVLSLALRNQLKGTVIGDQLLGRPATPERKVDQPIQRPKAEQPKPPEEAIRGLFQFGLQKALEGGGSGGNSGTAE